MNADEYQWMAGTTLPTGSYTDRRSVLTLGALGLAGEAGEVVDIIKKDLFHDRPLDHDDIKKELGDVAWYLAAVCTALGFSLSDVLETNIAKLKARWPEGFKMGVVPNG